MITGTNCDGYTSSDSTFLYAQRKATYKLKHTWFQCLLYSQDQWHCPGHSSISCGDTEFGVQASVGIRNRIFDHSISGTVTHFVDDTQA